MEHWFSRLFAISLLSLGTTIVSGEFLSDAESYDDAAGQTAPAGTFWGAIKDMGGKFTNVVTGKGQRDADQRDPVSTGASESESTFDPASLPPTAAGKRLTARQRTRHIQLGLAKLGYSPGPADGVAGEQTKRAIFDFQIDRGMYADGEPSADVLEAIGGNRRASNNSYESCLARVNRDQGQYGRVQLTSSQYQEMVAQQQATAISAGLIGAMALAPFTGGASLAGAGAMASTPMGAASAQALAAQAINPAQMSALMQCMGDSR